MTPETQMAVLEAKLDMIINILNEEKVESKEIHKDLENNQEKLAKKLQTFEKIQYGMGISLTAVIAVGIVFLRKVTGI